MLTSQPAAALLDAGCAAVVDDFRPLAAALDDGRGAAYYAGTVASPLAAAPADGGLASTLKLAGGASAVLAALLAAFFAANGAPAGS